MFARDGWVVEDDVVALGASDGEIAFQIAESRDAEVDVPPAYRLDVDQLRLVDVTVVPLRVRQAGRRQPHPGELDRTGDAEHLPRITVSGSHPLGGDVRHGA